MTTDNQSLFQRARAQILELQRRRAVKRREEKREQQELTAEIELFMDDALASGLDPKNPADFAVIVRAFALKKGEELPVTDDDSMERDHRNMDF